MGELEKLRFKEKLNKKRFLSLLILICILLGYVVLCASLERIEKFTQPYTDGMTYYNAARNILKYGVMTEDRDGSMFNGLVPVSESHAIAVGYPLFLSLLFKLFPISLHTVFVSNIILGLATLILVYLITRQMKYGRIWSLVAVLLVMIYPATTEMTSTCLTENLFFPLVMCSHYFMIRGKEKSRWSICFQCIFLILASLVRGQAFLFLPIQLLYCGFQDHSFSVKRAFEYLIILAMTLIILYMPMWIWFYAQTGQFIIYPSSGDDPRIYGVMPYYIDMPSSLPYTLQENLQMNRAIEPGVYYRWRIFGIIWKSWYDVWSEDLRHSSVATQWALNMHLFCNLSTLLAVPVFLKRMTREEKYLAAIPILLTIGCIYTHGLPRYVALAQPYLLILFTGFLQHIGRWKKEEKRKENLLLRIFYSLFSVLVAYSVFIFPWRVDEEQSMWRVAKYEGLNLSESTNRAADFSMTLDGKDMILWNAQDLGGGVFQIDRLDYPILQITDIPRMKEFNDDSKCITRVSMKIDGGALADSCRVYWLSDTVTTPYDDSHVYSVPRSSLNLLGASEPCVYIDDDATEILIIPVVNYGSSITIREIQIDKFCMGPESE